MNALNDHHTFKVLNIRHTGIVVDNYEKAKHFFKELLGFSIASENLEEGDYVSSMLGISQKKVQTLKMTPPGREEQIELLYFPDTDNKLEKKIGLTDMGITHFALQVDDVDKVYEKLVSEGYSFVEKPLKTPGDYAKVGFCQGPGNFLIEFVQIL